MIGFSLVGALRAELHCCLDEGPENQHELSTSDHAAYDTSVPIHQNEAMLSSPKYMKGRWPCICRALPDWLDRYITSL